MRRWVVLVAVVMLAATFASAALAGSAPMSRKQYGADWPLTVKSGIVSCDAYAVTFTTGGKRYAINGIARARHAGADIFKNMWLWRKDPAIPGARIAISPIIYRGLELC